MVWLRIVVKYVKGPAGGDGGKGADVVFVVEEGLQWTSATNVISKLIAVSTE